MAENAFLWSVTASSNDIADPAVNWAEGMAPGAVNNSARATMAGIARLLRDINGTLHLSGSSNAYFESCWSGHTSYTEGILITAKAASTNTGPATFNLNSFGAKNIRVFNSTTGEAPVAAGQIVIGGIYQLKYDTAADSAAGGWILLNPSPDASAQFVVGDIKVITENTLPAGWLYCNGAAVSRTTYAALFSFFGLRYGSGDGSTTFNVPDYRGRALYGKGNMGGVAPAGRVTIAFDETGLGNAGGAETHTLTTSEIPSHTHTGTTDSGGIDHTHTGTTGSGGVDHSHTASGVGVVTGSTFSAAGGTGFGQTTVTTSGASAFAHTHGFTTSTASVVSHAHTFTSNANGGGTAHSITPPGIVVNFIVKY